MANRVVRSNARRARRRVRKQGGQSRALPPSLPTRAPAFMDKAVQPNETLPALIPRGGNFAVGGIGRSFGPSAAPPPQPGLGATELVPGAASTSTSTSRSGVEGLEQDPNEIFNQIVAASQPTPATADAISSLSSLRTGVSSDVSGGLKDAGLSDLGRTTLDEQLSTGFLTDTSGAVDPAFELAQSFFSKQLNELNEKLSVMGQASSSARVAKTGDLAQEIALQQAFFLANQNIAAQENAANRRAGGVGLDLGEGQLKAGALGNLGSLELQGQGLGIQANTAAGNLSIAGQANTISGLGTAASLLPTSSTQTSSVFTPESADRSGMGGVAAGPGGGAAATGPNRAIPKGRNTFTIVDSNGRTVATNVPGGGLTGFGLPAQLSPSDTRQAQGISRGSGSIGGFAQGGQAQNNLALPGLVPLQPGGTLLPPQPEMQEDPSQAFNQTLQPIPTTTPAVNPENFTGGNFGTGGFSHGGSTALVPQDRTPTPLPKELEGLLQALGSDLGPLSGPSGVQSTTERALMAFGGPENAARAFSNPGVVEAIISKGRELDEHSQTQVKGGSLADAFGKGLAFFGGTEGAVNTLVHGKIASNVEGQESAALQKLAGDLTPQQQKFLTANPEVKGIKRGELQFHAGGEPEGVVRGPDTPPDAVNINVTGGELIVPTDTVEMIAAAGNTKEKVAAFNAVKSLIGKSGEPPINAEFAHGGSAPTLDPEALVQQAGKDTALIKLLTFLGTFATQQGAEPFIPGIQGIGTPTLDEPTLPTLQGAPPAEIASPQQIQEGVVPTPDVPALPPPTTQVPIAPQPIPEAEAPPLSITTPEGGPVDLAGDVTRFTPEGARGAGKGTVSVLGAPARSPGELAAAQERGRLKDAELARLRALAIQETAVRSGDPSKIQAASLLLRGAIESEKSLQTTAASRAGFAAQAFIGQQRNEVLRQNQIDRSNVALEVAGIRGQKAEAIKQSESFARAEAIADLMKTLGEGDQFDQLEERLGEFIEQALLEQGLSKEKKAGLINSFLGRSKLTGNVIPSPAVGGGQGRTFTDDQIGAGAFAQ